MAVASGKVGGSPQAEGQYVLASQIQQVAKATIIVCTVLSALGGALCLYYGMKDAPSFGKYSLLVTGASWGVATLMGVRHIYRAFDSSVNDPANRILAPAFIQICLTFTGPLELIYYSYKFIKEKITGPTL